jgi:phenylalanyl-tRNA synthetase beta chain
MIVNYNWLSEWVNIKTPPDKLSDFLAKIGIEVEEIEEISGDTIYKIDITPNRGDLLSVIGIAREIAAKTGKKLKKTINYKFPEETKENKIDVKIESEEDCPRYTASPLDNIQVSDSPSFITERLKKCGIRPLNNVIDITNYVLLETGQPLHAFDFDKLKDGITVRRAKKREKIITLEEEEKELSKEDLIIADGNGPIALAGIMGGLKSGITDDTKRIILESAFFKPSLIREASRKLKISTESSYRFERTVDMYMVGYAAYYAIQLFKKYAKGNIMGNIVDTNPNPTLAKKIPFSYSKIDSLLGMKVEKEKSVKILESLGFKVNSEDKDKAEALIPSHRNDLEIEEDLIEEIGRFTGYENIPLKFKYANYTPVRTENKEIVEIKKIMVRMGFWEAINIPFIESEWASKKNVDAIYLENPMWSDKEILRNTLIPGLLENVKRNLNRGEEIVKIFEVGRIFSKDKEEEENIGGVIAGKISKKWYEKEREVDFYDIKGIIETLLEDIKIKDYSLKDCTDPLFIKERSSSINLGGELCGTFGMINQEICKNDVFGFEISLKKLLKYKKEDRFKKVSIFPPLKRDISIIVDEKTPFEEIETLLDNSARQNARIKLIDVYSAKKFGKDKKSLTIRLEFYNPNKTLTDDETKDDIKEITTKLKSIGATLRE